MRGYPVTDGVPLTGSASGERRKAQRGACSRSPSRSLEEQVRDILANKRDHRSSALPRRKLRDWISDDQHYSMLIENHEAAIARRGVEKRVSHDGLVQSDIMGRNLDYELGMKFLLEGRVSIYADVVEVKTSYGRGNSKPGTRGVVRNMSRASRNRLIRLMSKVRGLENALFTTLTWPSEYSDDWRDWKKKYRALIRRVERLADRLGIDVSGIWRLEFQKRGAPHFHILMLGLDDNALMEKAKQDKTFMRYLRNYEEAYPEHTLDLENNWIHAFRAFLSWAWFEVVDSGDVKHLRAGVQADKVQNRRHAMHYVSKYVAKQDDQFQTKKTGRVWGKFGDVDTSPSLEFRMPALGMIEFRRMLSKYLKSKGRRKYAKSIKRGKLGFFVLGLGDASENNDQLIARMIDICLDYSMEREKQIPGRSRYRLENDANTGLIII